MKKTYTLNVAGLTRELPMYEVNDKLDIAAFILFGDVELTEKTAEELVKICPEHDIVITAEAKSIALCHEVAKLSCKDYVIARKGEKIYMTDPISVTVKSITTEYKQKLYLGQEDLKKIKGKRVLIVDDVISTGDSLLALEELVRKAGGNVVGKAAVLAEGEAADRDDIISLEKLPLFFK